MIEKATPSATGLCCIKYVTIQTKSNAKKEKIIDKESKKTSRKSKYLNHI